MPKSLYEEALTDAKQLKEVAEANAKRAIIEAVTPKIKEMIERQLLGETSAFEEDGDNEIQYEADGLGGSLGTTPPGMDGETSAPPTTTAEPPPTTESFEVTSESIDALLPFSNRTRRIVDDKLELKVYEVTEKANELMIASAKTKASDAYIAKINETIQEIEDMYQYVQESTDSSRMSKLTSKLERSFSVLTAVKETTMRMKDLVSEANLSEETEVTLKVTGLPDDVELDKLNIDIISDEDEEMGAMPGDEMSGEPPMGGEEPTGGEGPAPMPSEGMYEMDEEEVVEISETMLRQEIARMKKLSEGDKKVAPVNAHGHKMDADILSDFGGGKDDGEPWLDGEVSTADKDNMVKQGKTAVKESAEEDLDESDELDESDDLEETDLKGKMDDDHLPEVKQAFAAAKKALKEATDAATLTAEKFTSAKATYAKHKGGKHHAKAYSLAEGAYKAHKAASARVAAATSRFGTASKVLKESLKNSGSKQLAESKAAIESLRKQLVEVNLLNAKLIQANKLLQIEGLTVNQKATVIDKLDEAQNLKEVKLVYESLVSAFGGKKQVAEGAQRPATGSSSRTTRSAGAPPAPLNEGASVEVARWGVLAGLSK